jgi:DNA-binding MarR family transcriptional regulator|tara:strand:- start:183 stop:620 length:438 start_codon:yes stop_codon:yes gene_type:complete
MNLYDEFLESAIKHESARSALNDNIKQLGIPDIYVYDSRYTKLWLVAEIATRKKGYFLSAELRSKTNLSDKSVERFIKCLTQKGFFKSSIGEDKRVKIYFPSKVYTKHIRATWPVRVLQVESMLDLGDSKLKKIKQYLKTSKNYS